MTFKFEIVSYGFSWHFILLTEEPTLSWKTKEIHE